MLSLRHVTHTCGQGVQSGASFMHRVSASRQLSTTLILALGKYPQAMTSPRAVEKMLVENYPIPSPAACIRGAGNFCNHPSGGLLSFPLRSHPPLENVGNAVQVGAPAGWEPLLRSALQELSVARHLSCSVSGLARFNLP